MEDVATNYNSSVTCKKLNGAYSSLDTAAESLIERIQNLSTKINECVLVKDSIQLTNKIK